MSRSGLGRRTALGTATLLIGANLSDVDVLAYLDGPAADLSFRRGWTYGILALVVLPFVFTGLVLLFDRLVRRVGRAVLFSAVRPRQVLLLATIAILSHPVFDTLNTYGVRWLMLLAGDWFYGDTLFIVDSWLWLGLAVSTLASRRPQGARHHDFGATRPACVAFGVCVVYVTAMAVMGGIARGIARRELSALGSLVEWLMVVSRPISPFARQVVAAQGSRYRVGTFRWLVILHVDPASLWTFSRPLPGDPLIAAAREQQLGRRFLGWARFSTVQADTNEAGQVLVHLIDLCYADRPGSGFGSVTLALAGTGRVSSTLSNSGSAFSRRTPR